MPLKLLKYVNFAGTLTCVTGLRIGGSKEDIEIGGTDNPIIRHPLTKRPYIPGSSLKGKMRSLMELAYGKVSPKGGPCECRQADCLVCIVFGTHNSGGGGNLGPTRILVRDARLTPAWVERLEVMREEGLVYAEAKSENRIDRRSGRAMDPRTVERVPEGAQFELRIALRIFEGDDETRLVDFVKEGLKRLEADYLGASGSRGYGQVSFDYEVG
jgi:CRISPR-associated protein Csm3